MHKKNNLTATELECRSGLLFLVACKGYWERDFTQAIHYSEKYLKTDPSGGLVAGYGMEIENFYPLWQSFTASNYLMDNEEALLTLLKLWTPTENFYYYSYLWIDYGKLLYEWNRLEEAEVFLLQTIKTGKKHRNLNIELKATILLIKVKIAAQQTEQADYLLSGLHDLVKQQQHSKFLFTVENLMMQRNWQRGDLTLSRQWLVDDEKFAVENVFWTEMLTEQKQIDKAVQLVGRLLWKYKRNDEEGAVIQLLLHQSILLEKKGHQIQSFYAFEEALYLARKNKYFRIFLDMGNSIMRLFESYLTARKTHSFGYTNEVPIDYVRSIYRFFSLEDRLKMNEHVIGSVKILTNRELEVLQYMDKGLANKEIAFHLNRSISTIKTHINNIYCKLQVNSRVQALQRAYRLGLIKH